MVTSEKAAPRSLKVYFDPQIFIAQGFGGISKYFVELIREFQNVPGLGIQPVFYKFPMRLNRYSADLLGISFIDAPRLVRQILFIVFALLPPKPADILHLTFYSRLYHKPAKSWTVTLYDMIPETHGFAGKNNPHMQKAWMLSKARSILSISQASAHEMKALLSDVRAQVFITPLAGKRPVDSSSLGHECHGQFLFVGERGGYKQGSIAIQALAKTEASENLLFVGKPFSESEIGEIHNLGLADRVRVIRLGDQGLELAYRESCALVFPSETEGFGLPVLEAMALGTPVIARDNDVNREISGDAPRYFDGSAESLAEQMRAVCSSASERNRRVESGLKVAAQYSWNRTANETSLAYYRMLERVRF